MPSVTSALQELAPALGIDARLTEIERSVDLLLNITPVNAAEAWADFERSDFVTAPTLRLRPLEFEPDLVRRDLYGLEIETVADLRCTRCSARSETRSHDRSRPWKTGTRHGSCTGRCSSTEGPRSP